MRKSISTSALLIALTVGSIVVVSGEASVNAANTTKPIVRLLTSTTKQAKTSQAAPSTTASTTTTLPSTGSAPARLVVAARGQVGVTTGYDPSYVRIAYPGGDVPIETGVCSDVIIRALRKLDIDLQVKIHEDMAKNFSKYPKKWGLKKTDTNIDHRRVGNISTYFTRRGYSLPITKSAADYLPGDVVAIKLPLDHIGIVSDKKAANGNPLIIHNIGNGAQEEDILFAYEIVGHYRVLK
jgi:uncharacterized protein